ncbi:hypothetical protein J2X68_000952 [Streptomyces sp. 3330]|nr:hypothetical protein [Streptomyces sp. 3330]
MLAASSALMPASFAGLVTVTALSPSVRPAHDGVPWGTGVVAGRHERAAHGGVLPW